MTSSSPTPLAVSVPRAALMLGLSARTAWRRVNDGTIPTIRIGGRVVVPVKAIEGLLRPDQASA